MSDNKDVSEKLDTIADAVRDLSKAVHGLTDHRVVNVKSRVEHFENWLQAESRINELEVTQGAQTFMESLGYHVTPLQVSKVTDEHGNTLVEWDGVFVAEKSRGDNVLAVVESKHNVAQDHVVNRLDYVQRFKRFLDTLRRQDNFRTGRACHDSVCGALRPFCTYDVVLFMGGPQFNENTLEYAREHGVYCVTVNGSRYKVLRPKNTRYN